jgi:hypothetical protein
MTASIPLGRWLKWFRPEAYHQLARQAQWLIRQGKIDAYDFFTSLLLAQMSALRLTLNAQAQSLRVPVSRQAVHARYNQAAVDYFKAGFHYGVAELLHHSPDQPLAEVLRAHFSAVYLVDSTSYDCPASLRELFPACGGDGSAANVKLLCRYEWITGRLEPLQMLPGKRSDQGLSQDIAKDLRPGALYLKDKAFVAAVAWRAAEKVGAFLLSPLPRSLTLWRQPQDHPAPEPLDLVQELAQSKENQMEWAQVWVGRKEHQAGPLRIVAFRLSEESANRQRAKLRESLRKQGRLPTEAALELAGWLILVTNAPAQKLPSPILSYVYRLRWQVELVFRACKWVFRLDESESDNPFRVQCEWWARLLCAVLTFNWHAHANALSWRQHRQEISFEQVSRLLQQWGHALARGLVQGASTAEPILQDIWRRILKNARKGRQKTRTNTWDLLLDRWLEPKPQSDQIALMNRP